MSPLISFRIGEYSVMLILNPVQEIQHNHHVMPDLIRHPHGTGMDPESSSG